MEDPIHKLLHSPASVQWHTLGTHPRHGINVPLFSLRSDQSCGIGEFPDLLPLIPWCRSLGFTIIQLLPINDSGPETSPYCALSATALNPLHLGLSQLPHLDRIDHVDVLLAELRQYNQSQRIDYPKIQMAREVFLNLYCRKVGPLITATNEYAQFLQAHSWLLDYALFKAIKSDRNWQPWEEWPHELQHKNLSQLLEQYREAISDHCVIQFLCFQQMQAVKAKAEASGVYIKGDIPILINRESADVWQWERYFLLDFAAGAPPDMYAKEGQKWGFPLYNWKEMERSHYSWWKLRLHAASSLYHLYRLDHVVGFFRIWGIPFDKPAKDGHFMPADPKVWIAHGEAIMRMMLKNCPLLPIGEDLGTVPPTVRSSLKKLGICGTKVMRWERDWDGDKDYISYKKYPVASMTTVSTHDSPTLQQWWRDFPEEAEEFAKFKEWEYTPELSVDQHRQILHDSHHTTSLFHINLLNEYLALIPGMTWPDLDDERINIPGIISDRNWTYRFRPTVEEMISNASLTDELKRLID